MKYTFILGVLLLSFGCQNKETAPADPNLSCAENFKVKNENIRKELKALIAKRDQMQYGDLKQELSDLLRREGVVLKSLKGCNFNGDLQGVRNALQEVLQMQREIQQTLNQVEQITQ